MANSKNANEKWQTFLENLGAGLGKAGDILQVIGNIFKVIASWVIRLHKIFLAAPVVIGAVYLAQYNYDRLPSQVGINILSSGEYAQMISRDTAVVAPLVVTGICLLLMFCSRRTVYPWIISVFSLALPLLILVTNIFPA